VHASLQVPMQFTIRSASGETVQIDAINWLFAMAKAADLLDVNTPAFGEWLCRSQADGTVVIEDQQNRRSWMIQRLAPAIKIVAVGATSAPQPELDVREEREPEPVFIVNAPPPAISMPLDSTLRKEEAIFSEDDMAEHLFELSFDITGANPDDACKITLDHVASFIDCVNMNVVRGTLNDERMNFLVGRGELGAAWVGHNVEFGVGAVGRCHGSGMVMEVHEPTAELVEHLPESTRAQVKSMLCLPVVNNDGWTFGVIQVTNPPKLEQQQIDIVAALARTLGATLARGI
jgi:hypothetical protein